MGLLCFTASNPAASRIMTDILLTYCLREQVQELQKRRITKPMTDTERALNKKYLDEINRLQAGMTDAIPAGP